MNVKDRLTFALSSVKNRLSSMSKDSIRSRHILSDIEEAIEKSADRGDSLPEDKYVNEILFLVSNSPGSITFFARRLSTRLEAARDDRAVLKTLALLHRLLRGGDRFFEQDLRLLWLSGELRISPHDSCDPFIVSYSLFLQERMEWLINQGGKLEPVRPHGLHDKVVELVLYNISRCQVLLDRVMECLPNGRGLSHESQPIVISVLNIVVRESFSVYDTFCDGIHTVISSLLNFRHERFSVLSILRKTAMQTPKLKEFYEFCKSVLTGKNLEYPSLRIITDAELSSMERFAAAVEGSEYEGKMVKSDAMTEGGRGGGGVEMKVEGFKEERGSPFSQKLETKISAIWVEFNEEEGDPLALCESSKSSKAIVLL